MDSENGQRKYTGPLPDKYFNNEGELDLRNVTGDEALAYYRSIGRM